jgi:DNA-binding transcriptional regulator PaaX
LSSETRRWREAIQFDPLLPNPLLPKNYLGKKAWAERRKLLLKSAQLIEALAMNEEREVD